MCAVLPVGVETVRPSLTETFKRRREERGNIMAYDSCLKMNVNAAYARRICSFSHALGRYKRLVLGKT